MKVKRTITEAALEVMKSAESTMSIQEVYQDDYEVEDYATGMVDGKPTLCKMDETREVLMLDDEEVKRHIL